LRLFVLLSRFPYPLEKGDKLRAYHQLRILSQHHEVFLCALHEEELRQDWIDHVKPFCKEMLTIRLSRFSQGMSLVSGIFGQEPLQVAYFFQLSAKRKIDEAIARFRPDAIYCQLLRTAKYVDHIQDVRKVIDFQDAFSKGIERRLETDPWYWKPILKTELKRLNRYEQKVFATFDRCTIISEQDRDQLPFGQRHQVVIVRNGVELESFVPTSTEKQVDVLFAGNMGYPPNVDAAIFLANEVMPFVRQRFPKANLMLAGARPDNRVKELADDLTEVTGWVDDISKCYAKAKVFVAPMMIGTGLQNKLLEAMAMQIPCVTSKLANNALCAKEGTEVFIANSPSEYAKWVIDLLDNDQLAKEVGLEGYRFVAENFSWEGATQPLLNLIGEA
jgi:sugar transferase (PEP-CTERM/EpsH1 system associated)